MCKIVCLLPKWQIAKIISLINRIVTTICIQIGRKKCSYYNTFIRINKPTDNRIIVYWLKFLVEVIRCTVINYFENAILDQRPYKNCTVFGEVFWQESANLSDKLIANMCICYHNLHYIALYPFCQWSFDFFNIFVSII